MRARSPTVALPGGGAAQKLSEVIDQANRVNSNPIRLADPALGSLEVTGRFVVTDSASLARKLSAVFGLSAHESGGAIILSRKKTGG